MSNFSHIPVSIQQTFLPNTTTVITSDTTIYIGPNGNDTTGIGTETLPYATLKKAWEVASTFVIRGNAILYITFLKGKYWAQTPNDFFPEIIYHPQANNIIIQGDPRSLTQHYLFSVDNYNWNISKFTTHGHTGTVQLWTRGTTSTNSSDTNNAFAQSYSGAGTTAHGFIGDGTSRTDDVGSFVSISNPWLGAPMYYYDAQNLIQNFRYHSGYIHRLYYDSPENSSAPVANRTHSECTHDAYAALWYGHQPAYTSVAKHGHHLGILGLARVRKIVNAGKLDLDFINMNMDMRAGTFHDSGSGGIRNVQSQDALHGVPGNLPENKLYDPVGYYGATYMNQNLSAGGRKNVDGAVYTNENPSSFPSLTQSGASRQVTDESLLVTSYTATIIVNSAYTSNSPINVVGCSLRALRNLCFVRAGFGGGTGSTNLETIHYDNASGLGTLVSCHYGGVGGIPTIHNGPCINLMDSSLGIRHIGIFGFGAYYGQSAITLTRSKLTAYSDFEWYTRIDGEYSNIIGGNVNNTERRASGHMVTYARLRSLNNTPILNAFSSGPVIYAQNSLVDFAMTSGILEGYNTYYTGKGSNSDRLCDESVIMRSGSGYVVSANQSEIRLTSAVMTNNSQFPGNRFDLFLPYWAGMTYAASTSSTGVSTGVYSPTSSIWGNTAPHGNLISDANRFANMVGYIKTATSPGKGITFCRVSYRTFRNSTEYTYYDPTFVNAGVSGSTFTFNGGTVPGPSYGISSTGGGWRLMTFYMIPVGTFGNKMYSEGDFQSELSIGNTFEFHAYLDNAEQAGYSGSVLISDKYIAMQTPGGTYEVKSPGGTGARVGRSAIYAFIRPYDLKPTSPASFPHYAWSSGCIELMNESTLSFEKNLILYGGANAICAKNGSSLYSQNRSDVGTAHWPSTYLLMGGQSHRGIWAVNGSTVKLGSVYSKDPPVAPSGNQFQTSGEFNQLRAERNSRIQVSGDSILVSPTRTANNCWSKPRPNYGVNVNANWGGNGTVSSTVTNSRDGYLRTVPVWATKGSEIVLVTDEGYGSRAIFASDGSVYPSGSAPTEFQDANAVFIRATEQSRVRVPQAVSTQAIVNGGTQPSTDFVVLGWSGGVGYKIQRCQGVTAHRFTDQTSTNSMWRFWNKRIGTITGSTAFVLFPVRAVLASTPGYGVSDSIAVDGQRMSEGTVLNPYGEYMIKPIMGSAGLSYAFTNNLSADGSAIFRAEF